MLYCCETCGKRYSTEEQALECERVHKEEKARQEELAKEKILFADEEKFPAAGGDSEHAVDGAPGSFDVSNADSLSYLLTFPADDASLIDSAASLVHMMNLNTFTCGAFHVADANNVARLADDLRTTIQAKHWMCGFPDKLVIVTVGQSVLSVYGNEDLVNTFRDKLLTSYSAAAAVYDEAINA